MNLLYYQHVTFLEAQLELIYTVATSYAAIGL